MSDSENKNEECIKLFCQTIGELNTISLKQIEGLLNIAIRASEAVSSNGDAADAGKIINELKAASEEISRKAHNQEEEIYENVKNTLSAEPKHSYCEEVEGKLIIALENSLSNQQQLNVLGAAILAQAASMILSPAAETE